MGGRYVRPTRTSLGRTVPYRAVPHTVHRVTTGGAKGLPSVILGVHPDGAAAAARVAVGERLLAINGAPVTDHDTASQLLRAATGEVVRYVEESRPEASANLPSSTPRQRQIKLRAAFSLGQLVDMFWLAGDTGFFFHLGGPAHRTTQCWERARSARRDATATLAARPPRRRDAGTGAAAGGNGGGREQVQAPGRSRGAARAISRRGCDLAGVPLRCQVRAAAVQAPARGLRPQPASALGNGRAPRPPLPA